MLKKLVLTLAFVFVSLFFPRVSFAQDLCTGYRQPDASCVVCVRTSGSSCTQWAAQDVEATPVACPSGYSASCNICLAANSTGECSSWGSAGTGSRAPVVGSLQFSDPVVKTYIEGQGKVNNQNLTKDIANAWASWLVCSAAAPATTCITEGSDSNPNASLNGTLASLIGGMYQTPAADTQTYLADVLQDANIAQPAYAQGVGFSSLTPILDAWKMFRNVAYLFFILIFLVIGFLIMFRQKISGQTVVTAEQALPNVIISLLFVTFSYAIAGLLIDVMYLLMYLVLAIFGRVGNQDTFMAADIFTLGQRLINGQTILSVGQTIDQVVNAAIADSGVDALSAFAGIAAMVIFSIAMVFGVFRLFFELLKTYVNIILSVVLSPILLMIGALPGKNVFRDWIQDLIGNLSAFPVVLIVMIIYDQITGGISNDPQLTNTYNEGGFMPPYLLGYGTGGAASGIFRFVIGLGVLLTIPEIVKQLKKALGAKDNFGWFASGLADSIKRGWQGGELIPGVGFTDTRKWPMGGLSGQNVIQKASIFGAATAGGAANAATQPSRPVYGFRRGFSNVGGAVAGQLGDKQAFQKAQAERKKRQEASKGGH